MINHVRTLLLNYGRDGKIPTDPGEEYVPKPYVTRQLSGPVALAHRTLLGSNPDRLFINYRLRQLMRLVHASELHQDTLIDDPRITYLPFDEDLFASAFGDWVTADDQDQYPIYVTGQHVADEQNGICSEHWRVTILSASTARVLHRQQTQDLAIATDGAIELPGTTIRLYVPTAPTNHVINLSAAGRPQLGAIELLQLTKQLLGPSGIDRIFAGEDATIQTWKQIWNQGTAAVIRYAAFLLALAYQIERSPQGRV